MTHDNNPNWEVLPMTTKNIRASLLATVIVGMLSGSAIAADRGPRQGEPPRSNAATMGDQQSFSRFIVTYRDGAAAKNNRSAIARNMAIALSRAGLSTKARPANASYIRQMAIGSALAKPSRNPDRANAGAFMRTVTPPHTVEHAPVPPIAAPDGHPPD